jgi:uncharacterized membrane protein
MVKKASTALADGALPSTRILSARRALTSLAAGAVAGVIPVLLGVGELAPLTVWVAASGMALIWVWRTCWPVGPDRTKFLAEAERESRSTDVAVIVAAVISLAAVVVALIRASGVQNAVATAGIVLSVAAVVLAWALVNTVFALKYARLYYFDDDGGIDFKQQEPPSYSDFAYMAFTIGMSFAVSDSEPASTGIRRVALGHALLSYAFGTGVIAVTINLISNL